MSLEAIEANKELSAMLPQGKLVDAYHAQSVLSELSKVPELFKSAGLEPEPPFIRTYSLQTDEVIEHIDIDGYFDQPETIIRTIAIFAQYYIDVLNAHSAEGSNDQTRRANIPLPWRVHMYAKNPHKIPDGFFALAGMENHVERDLPLALLTSDVDDSYYEDYEKIDELIHNVATDLSADFVPFGSPFRDPTIDLVVSSISRLRKGAWRDFEILKACKGQPNQEALIARIVEGLDRDTAARARVILGMGRLVGKVLS